MSDYLREDLVNALADLPENEQEAVQKVIDNRWPVCVGRWDAEGAKQSYTCLMGAAALAATEHVWGQIPELCADFGTLEELVSEHLSETAHDVVPGAFDEFFAGDEAHQERFTTIASGTSNVRILNAAGRGALQSALTEAREQRFGYAA